MNEKQSSKLESAEKSFLIDKESGYFSAVEFSNTPVDFLTELRIVLQDEEGYEGGELVQGAVSALEELRDVILNEGIVTENVQVLPLLEAEYLSYKWGKIIFPLLKQSSFSASEIADWFLTRQDGISPEKELQERNLQMAFRETFQ